MALTAAEAIKVTGKTMEKIGTDMEKHEEENDGEKMKFTSGYIVETVITLMADIGVEIQD